MEAWWEGVQKGFYQTFILKDNYMYFLKGIRITLLVTVLALILGVILGVLVAVVLPTISSRRRKEGFCCGLLTGSASFT